MMKKIILYLASITLLFVYNEVKAQDCDFYFPNKKGSLIETTYFDKKNKETGVATFTILENKKTADGQEVKVASEFKAAEGDYESKQEYSLVCKGGEFYINMDSYLDKNSMSAYKNMDIEVDVDQMTLPANLKAGQILNDGRVTAKILNNGVKIITINTLITDRKVEGFEKVTTPAGSFDCVKISYTLETKMMFKIKMSGAEWFAKGVGAVKTESYNKKGKLESSSMITKLED
jgi:hypothetical protein